MEDDDNIIPYRALPTLTVEQAVMYMLGYRGEYSFFIPHTQETLQIDLEEYTYRLQEEAGCAVDNAKSALKELKKDKDASPGAIKIAEGKVKTTKANLEEIQKLNDTAQQYTLLINHEIRRIKNGKRSPLVLDEEKSGGQPHIITASFLEWLEDIELEDDDGNPAPIDLPVDEDDFCKAIGGKKAESLHVTLGLLVSLFAESGGDAFGSGQAPNISRIAEEMAKYAKQRNGGYPLHGQGKESIKDRVELALSALNSNI